MSFSGSFTPNYLEDTSLGLEDAIFTDGFESGDLSHWSSSVTDGGNLAVDSEAAYWGEYGMEAVMDDNNAIYVQDDTPNGEQGYHARFYFNPNAITMASGDIFDLFQGYTSSTNVFRIQVQKASGVYQVRIGARNDAGTWADSAWQNLVDGWNALEIDYQAAHNAGSLSLWVGGTLKANLSAIDNDGSKIDSVRLGAQGVDAGTRGTVYFDDFESRRFSEIGLLPDPGIPNPTPTPVPGWDNVSYTYGDPDHVHAVTGLSNGSTYTYDANGNQICRVENSQTFVQVYNADCAAPPEGGTALREQCRFRVHAHHQEPPLPRGYSAMMGIPLRSTRGTRVKQALRQAQD